MELITWFKKLVSSTMIAAMLCSALTLPKQATAQALPSNPGLTYVNGPYGSSYPLSNLRKLMEVRSGGNAGSSMQISVGELSLSNGNEAAAALGVSEDQLSQLIYSFPSNTALVLGRLNPLEAELRIFVFKTKKLPNGTVQIFLGDYTPHHGQRMVAAREYMSAAERSNTNRGGNNPFAGNRSSNNYDPIFYNCNSVCAQIAMGHAMKEHNSLQGFLAVADMRLDQDRQEYCGFLCFTKTVVITTNGYVKPRWFVASPIELQPDFVPTINTGLGPVKTSVGVCAVDESPCDPGHIVRSGIALADWSPGNLNTTEQREYNDVESYTSWTVLAFVALIAVAVFSGGVGILGMTALDAALLGAAFGGAYLVGYAIGGVSPTDTQFGLFGQTTSAARPGAPSDRHNNALRAAVKPKMGSADLTEGITGINKVMLGDNPCPPTFTAAQCSADGYNRGVMNRADSFVQHDGAQIMEERSVAPTDCITVANANSNKKERDRARARCAAPSESVREADDE